MVDTTTAFVSLRARSQDATFDLAKIAEYHLSIRLTPERLSLSIIELKKNRCVLLADYSLADAYSEQQFFSEVQQFFNTDHLLTQRGWGKITWCVRSRKFSLVPAELFDENNLASHLRPVSEVNENFDVLNSYVVGQGIVNVFATEKPLHNFISRQFDGAEYNLVPSTSACITGVLSNFSVDNSQQELFALVETKHLLIIVKKDGKLEYCNVFSWKAETELAYFILLVLQETGLDPTKDIVNLYGEVSRESKVFQAIYPFVKRLYLGERPAAISYSNEFDNLPGTRYFDLLSSHLC